MSKAVDLVRISTDIGTHDTDDMVKLGTFMLALARADLSKLGIQGNAAVKYSHGDYVAVFDGGNVIRRPRPNGALLFRESKCPIPECTEKTLNSGSKREFCKKHAREIYCLDEAV